MQRYSRPPNDPLFESMAPAEVAALMYEDLAVRRRELVEQLGRDKTSPEASRARDALGRIDEVLEGYNSTADELAEKWLRELEDGVTPDLEER